MRIQGNRWNESGTLETVSIAIQNGTITDIVRYVDVDPDLPLLMPGFIDIHIHGGGGADTMDASFEAFDTIVRTHARHGTTGLLLTTVTESVERIDSVLTTAKAYMDSTLQPMARDGGAAVLGVHLEGPFIHPKKAGAQRPDRIIEPDPALAERWFSSEIVKMMTLAPEMPGAFDVAKVANQYGVLASVGHTTATAEDVAAGKAAGFRHMTHLCNAMPPLLHRSVGPIGYLAEDQDFTADLICDGIHVDWRMVNVLMSAIGEERLLLITDAIRATSMPNGIYDLGGLTVTLRDGVCTLEDGTLAGSVLTMADAVSRLTQFGGVSSWTAQKMASANPARRLGMTKKGHIAVGFDADLVAFNSDGDVLWTMVGGTNVYEITD